MLSLLHSIYSFIFIKHYPFSSNYYYYYYDVLDEDGEEETETRV